MLEALVQLTNITLEELDLTVRFYSIFKFCIEFFYKGLTINAKQSVKIQSLFSDQPKLKCYTGPVRQSTEYFANYLVNLINLYCENNVVELSDIFNPNEGIRSTISTVTYEQFRDGLRRAKIPFPVAHIDDIMKYLVSNYYYILLPLQSFFCFYRELKVNQEQFH